MEGCLKQGFVEGEYFTEGVFTKDKRGGGRKRSRPSYYKRSDGNRERKIGGQVPQGCAGNGQGKPSAILYLALDVHFEGCT
jgi:hypothetical protein